MSADFWAGYLSGAVGIIIGNPLDIVKVRLQAQNASATSTPTAAAGVSAATTAPSRSVLTPSIRNSSALVTGTAAPILGYGALNAILFVSYNRSEAALNHLFSSQQNLWSTWFAGAIGGLATWVISTPTELIKCRAQLSTQQLSSWVITKQIWQSEGIRGLYFGGTVTAIRDSVGYGFYFWAYELGTRWFATEPKKGISIQHEAAKVLLCGGIAGVATWASVFPLDVIKTRVQAQPWGRQLETAPLLVSKRSQPDRRLGAICIAQDAHREGGARVFFRGLAVCSVRAFVVNAVQWAVYEWAMHKLGHGRREMAQNDAIEVHVSKL